MPQKVIIIGGVALGPKVACRIKRLQPDAQVTVVEKDNFISYGGCGIPYYVSGDVAELEGLQSTSAHVLRDPAFFKNAKGVRVLSQTQALSIDRKRRKVHVHNLISNTKQDIEYDQLVLATGAEPVIPPICGVDLQGVSVVANLHHAKAIKDQISAGQVSTAVVIGGGAIGIEMAEALTDLWGVQTTLVEMQDQLLPNALSPDMALAVKKQMELNDVRVYLNHTVTQIARMNDNGELQVVTTKDTFSCDLVILAVGVKPNVNLARKAGLKIGPCGGILVDTYMRTSDPTIYAGGDCVELPHLVSGRHVHMPLGSLANRQGRIIGSNIGGSKAEFKGTVGTFCVKAFDMGIASAGLTEIQAQEAGFNAVSVVVAQADRAHFIPTQAMMLMKLVADQKTRQVLGVQSMGPNPDAVKARVDTVAVLLSKKADVDEISNLEVAYSPPFASAMDIVNTAANALDNTIAGIHCSVDINQFLADFQKGAKVLDVRSQTQAEPFLKKYKDQWQNIPQEDLACRLEEVEKDAHIYLLCGAGARAYEAQLLLRTHGINQTLNIQGGMKMLISCDPDFVPAEKNE